MFAMSTVRSSSSGDEGEGLFEGESISRCGLDKGLCCETEVAWTKGQFKFHGLLVGEDEVESSHVR
jgi:hypothetical protein